MKKNLWILAGVGLILAATWVVALAHEKMDMKATGAAATETKGAAAEAAAPAEASFTGEILDLTCYASHPETGSGEAHASCAKTCLEKGLPVGLLVGDKAYLVVMKDHTAPNKTFA